MRIVSRAQLMLPILSEAVQRFADGLDSPTYYWDPMRHWASVQQLIDASIRLVGLRDLEKIGDFSATMQTVGVFDMRQLMEKAKESGIDINSDPVLAAIFAASGVGPTGGGAD
jgi:hypothetical protein